MGEIFHKTLLVCSRGVIHCIPCIPCIPFREENVGKIVEILRVFTNFGVFAYHSTDNWGLHTIEFSKNYAPGLFYAQLLSGVAHLWEFGEKVVKSGVWQSGDCLYAEICGFRAFFVNLARSQLLKDVLR